MLDSILLFLGLPGGLELLTVPFIVALLFGANKFLQLARLPGQVMDEFRRDREETEEGLEKGVEGSDDEDENGDEAEAGDADAAETEAESR